MRRGRRTEDSRQVTKNKLSVSCPSLLIHLRSPRVYRRGDQVDIIQYVCSPAVSPQGVAVKVLRHGQMLRRRQQGHCAREERRDKKVLRGRLIKRNQCGAERLQVVIRSHAFE